MLIIVKDIDLTLLLPQFQEIKIKFYVHLHLLTRCGIKFACFHIWFESLKWSGTLSLMDRNRWVAVNWHGSS